MKNVEKLFYAATFKRIKTIRNFVFLQNQIRFKTGHFRIPNMNFRFSKHVHFVIFKYQIPKKPGENIWWEKMDVKQIHVVQDRDEKKSIMGFEK